MKVNEDVEVAALRSMVNWYRAALLEVLDPATTMKRKDEIRNLVRAKCGN